MTGLCQLHAKRPLPICNNAFEHGFNFPHFFEKKNEEKTVELVGDGIL